MSNLFNVAEVIDMGIEKEKRRRDFYALVAERFTNKDLKELFTKLKNWEEGHIKKFSGIKKNVEEIEATDKYPGELNDYINAMIDDTLYDQVLPDKFAKAVDTPLKAIDYGIGFEKDAILFFTELLRFTVSSSYKIEISKLIDEEKEHIIYLTTLKRKIK
ncbi:MAG: ferritin family protein [Candidatus Omnitrophota bacterium]